MLGSPDSGLPVLTGAGRRSRRILIPLVVITVVGVAAGLLMGARSGAQSQLVGSGSTAAQPLVEGAAVQYRNAGSADRPDRPQSTGSDWVLDGAGIDYEPVGSLGGVLRLSDPDVDFAVTDYPLSQDSLTAANLAQFPVVIGSIAVVHTLDLPAGQKLTLDAVTLAGIWSGTITRWNDPAITALNPGLTLPDQPIVPVHRTDGSGSTFGFTGYLATAGQAWAPGTGSLVTWPRGVGRGTQRTSGMLATVADTPGAIGYVETGQARRAGLAVTALHNGSGTAVLPDSRSMRVATTGGDWTGADHYVTPLTGSSLPEAYPVTMAIYAVVEKDPRHREATRQALGFLSYLMEDYDGGAERLGYVPLPQAGADGVYAYWERELAYTR